MIRCAFADPSPSAPRRACASPARSARDRTRFGCRGPSWRASGEAVGEDPLVRVDGGPEQRLQPLRVLDDAADEPQCERADLRLLRRERVAAVAVGDRECRWNPEPPWSVNGRPMNVATRPSAAISFTALSMKALSAASSAPECFTLISYCEFMNSWFPAYASSPSSSAQSSILGLIWRGSETRPRCRPARARRRSA